VEVKVEQTADHCRISVADRGPGIPQAQLDRVFEAFYTTKQGGTGLGLAIVKRLTELQNGRVNLHSRDGGGTVAEVTLPRGPGRSQALTG
jgi:two-component system C4-dicarboxylate transport sensor histidine kinase DctB